MGNTEFWQALQDKTKFIADGFHAPTQTKLPHINTIKGIAIVGMGFSNIPGELAKDALAPYLNIPIITVNDDTLPGYITKDWLVMIVSYSGTTAETKRALAQATQRQANIIGFSTKINFTKHTVQQPPNYVPRLATVHTWMSILGTLNHYQLLPEQLDTEKLCKYMQKTTEEYCNENSDIQIWAEGFTRKIPYIHIPTNLQGVGKHAQGMFNENANRHALLAIMPEANHNQIQALAGDRNQVNNLSVMALTPARIASELDKRYQFVEQICRVLHMPYTHIVMDTDTETFVNHIKTQLAMLQFIDVVTYYTAEHYEVDPLDMATVTALKEYLKDN